MSAFTGTTAKCKACGKTVYLVEQLIADGVIYHKHCFRCFHCKGTLKLNSFASLEGVAYCKPHFDQLFKTTGCYNKSFEDAIKSEKERTVAPESVTSSGGISRFGGDKKVVNPLAARFGGTQEKCVVCGKTVYPLEKVSVENSTYHNQCFKCVHGGCKLTTSSYYALGGKLYCKAHSQQLFLVKGNFTELQRETGDGIDAGSQAAAAVASVSVSKHSTASPSKPAPAPVAAASPSRPAPAPAPSSAVKEEKPATFSAPTPASSSAPAPAAAPSAPAKPVEEKKPPPPPAKEDSDSDDDSDDSDSDSDDSDDSDSD